MAVLLPWPSRHQRLEAISHARSQKEVSQAGAAHAAVIGQDIERIRRENHFARAIAEQIARGRSGGAGP
jgi:hypothetical protein